MLLNETLVFANITFRRQHTDDVTSHCMGIFVTPQFVVVRHDNLGSQRYYTVIGAVIFLMLKKNPNTDV